MNILIVTSLIVTLLNSIGLLLIFLAGTRSVYPLLKELNFANKSCKSVEQLTEKFETLQLSLKEIEVKLVNVQESIYELNSDVEYIKRYYYEKPMQG